MKRLKRIFKRNTHNFFFRGLAGFGRSLNRMYENRNHDPYSNGELRVIKKLSAFDPRVIIDGGANIGNYSLMVNRHCPGCTIYAFEPVKSTCEELEKKVKDLPGIVPVNKGLYSSGGTKEINVFESSTHASVIDIKGLSYESVGKNTIELLKGDDFMREKGIEEIDLLKLDLEGAEYEAILGFEESFRSKKIRAVQFEFGYINITTKKLLIDFYALMNDYGYLLGKIFPKTVEFREYQFKYEDFLGPNFIAVKKEDVELINSLRNK